MARGMEPLQKLGRALMLPIAVLPLAAMLLRLGQHDMLDVRMLAAAGDAVFSHLGMLFAIGVAVGFARENHGAAGLAGLVGFLVASEGARSLLAVPPDVGAGLASAAAEASRKAWLDTQVARMSMPVGLINGLVAGWCYNRYSEVKLPSSLSFFGGRRFVPIVVGFVAVLVALLFGQAWPAVARAMDGLSAGVAHAGSLGLFLYGLLNRLLLVTGLHHILNNIVWFMLGDFHGVTGDLKRFFAGDPSAGDFMSGFFPVMMFGLPGACLAMYRCALPERRGAVGGLLLSIALTAFLTGVTEPVEFTFMFLAPLLYVVHAVLTGLSMVLMHALGVHLGFGFSAGLFDYLLNFRQAQHPLLLLPVGAAYFAVYYGLFRFMILRLRLATPGREPAEAGAQGPAVAVPSSGEPAALAFIAALGGAANLRTVDACTTRLRLEVADSARIDERALAALGAMGVVRPSAQAAQVVLGPVADQVAGQIRQALQSAANPLPAARAAAGAADAGAPGTRPSAAAVSAPPLAPARVADWLAALGGRANLLSVDSGAGRVLVKVADAQALDAAALALLAPRGIATTRAGELQLLVGEGAATLATALSVAR